MKKLGYILPAVFVFASALTASAQKIDTHQDRGETLKVTVTGDIDFHYILRSDDLTAAGAGGGPGFGSTSNTFEGPIGIRLDVELSEKINAVVSLRAQHLTGGTTTGTIAGAGVTVFQGADVANWGRNPENLTVLFDEASITLNELFNPALKLSVGIVPVSFDVRGRGNSFFFDPRHSSTFEKNLGTMGLGLSDELQPTGAHLVYAKDAISLGLFLLPAIIEGGPSGSDESAYGVWFFYNIESLGKGSHVGAIFAWNQMGAAGTGVLNNQNVFTIGAGADIMGLVEGLELYLEFYFQFGTAAEVGDVDVDQSAFAIQLGAQYNLPNNDNNIWFALNFKFLTGNDLEDTDDENNTFLSYENINDTMVLEDQWFGLDLDTNYWTIQGSVGAAFTVGSGALKNNLEVSLLFALNFLAQDVTTFDGNDTDEIGHELDLKLKIWASKQVSFDTGFGILFASDVLEEVIRHEGEDSDNVGYVWTVGSNLRY